MKYDGSARVIFPLITNSLILTPHTPSAISHAMTWRRSLYLALIHFFPAVSSTVSIREKSMINPPPTASPKKALFS